MGIEADRLRDQIEGSLQGTTRELEQAQVLLTEQQEKVDRLQEQVDELQLIAAHHRKTVTAK